MRALGMRVAITSAVGDGFTDLVVAWRGINALVEVKNPKADPFDRQLTKDQVLFHAEWTGPIFVVETIDDVIRGFEAALAKLKEALA